MQPFCRAPAAETQACSAMAARQTCQHGTVRCTQLTHHICDAGMNSDMRASQSGEYSFQIGNQEDLDKRRTEMHQVLL